MPWTVLAVARSDQTEPPRALVTTAKFAARIKAQHGVERLCNQ